MTFVFYRARASALPAAIASVVASAAAPTGAHAQSQLVASLHEVVVTASRNPQPLSAASAHTTVITRADIETSQAPDLVTLLQREAGLQGTQNGGLGSASTLFLRGMPSLDTLILIDGVPQTKQDASGAVSLEHILLDNVERIEIVRGNVSAIYGSGAIGGVIQIFTRAGSQEPSAHLGLELGPRNTFKSTAQVGLSAGDTQLSVGLTRLGTGGFSSVNTEQYTFANPDADGYHNTSSNLTLTHALSADHRLGLQWMQADASAQTDSSYSFTQSSDIQSSMSALGQTTVSSDNTFGRWRSRVHLSEQSQRDKFVQSGSSNSVYGYLTRTQTLRWVNTLPVGDNWLGTAGLEEQQQHVDTNADDGTPAYDLNRLADAVFVGLEGCLGPLTMQLNLRNDKVGSLSKDTTYLGLGYSLTDALKLTASTSTAFNAPPLGYLVDPYAGNLLLKPELAYSNEVGVQYSVGKDLIRATYFDTRVQDQLVYDSGTSKFGNINRARITGLEVSYRASVAGADVQASLTGQNPVDETTGKTLARRAKTMASLGASKPFGALRSGFNLRYVGERNDDTTQGAAVDLGAYSVLDVTLAYRYSPQLLLTARIDNLIDARYQTVYGYNQQARSLFAGLTWTPKR
ncbi:TonB-dependent receptor [Rhodoferax sp. OV413]|uniref:TonB-dependent receptor domain-containing protein n=1 Tax=Rhodoferax sp. OV413 TaxID=1855285 RepID=UPI0025F8CE31|nr:TonB-dependent receptor [Rhodoferax sp. OV413]